MAGVSVLDLAGLGALLDALHSRGYTVLGPTVRDGVITTGEVHTLEDLPRGVGDEQDAGHYRLRERDDDALFGFAAPMQSAKQVFFPAAELIWRGRHRADRGFTTELEQAEPSPVALFGVRSCDLAAVGVHDAVLADRQYVDTRYQARREGTFVVAAACAEPAGTCFCASMNTGPKPRSGYDIALTEILDGEHRFLAEAGTPAGEALLAQVPAPLGLGRVRLGDQRRDHQGPQVVADGSEHADRGAAGPALQERAEPPLGGRCQQMPGMHQLHDGVPDVLLHVGGGRQRPDRRHG